MLEGSHLLVKANKMRAAHDRLARIVFVVKLAVGRNLAQMIGIELARFPVAYRELSVVHPGHRIHLASEAVLLGYERDFAVDNFESGLVAPFLVRTKRAGSSGLGFVGERGQVGI